MSLKNKIMFEFQFFLNPIANKNKKIGTLKKKTRRNTPTISRTHRFGEKKSFYL